MTNWLIDKSALVRLGALRPGLLDPGYRGLVTELPMIIPASFCTAVASHSAEYRVQLTPRCNTQLGEDLVQVRAYGAVGDEQLLADLPVGQAATVRAVPAGLGG